MPKPKIAILIEKTAPFLSSKGTKTVSIIDHVSQLLSFAPTTHECLAFSGYKSQRKGHAGGDKGTNRRIPGGKTRDEEKTIRKRGGTGQEIHTEGTSALDDREWEKNETGESWQETEPEQEVSQRTKQGERTGGSALDWGNKEDHDQKQRSSSRPGKPFFFSTRSVT